MKIKTNQEKYLKTFYSISEKMRELASMYNDVQMEHLHSGIKKELRVLTKELKKVKNLLISVGINPFYLHNEKKHYNRSEFGQSWEKWLSSGDIAPTLYTNPHQLKFNWEFFGTLTVGFETITAKGIIRLTEKYFMNICDRLGTKTHNIKFFYVVEKFKTKFNEKDRYHVHFLLDCPDSIARVDFINHLDNVKNGRETDFVLHSTWQRLLKNPPQIFGEDDWSRIENKSVPKTARWHRTQFSCIKKSKSDFEKAISYVVKYICKEGKGVPHYNLLTFSDYLESKYKDLVVDYNQKRSHLQSLGCKEDSKQTKNNENYDCFFVTDKFINKSKNLDSYEYLNSNVRNGVALLKNPPSYEGYIENFFKFSSRGASADPRKEFPLNVDMSDFVESQLNIDFTDD